MTREQAAHLAHFAQYPSMTALAGFTIAAREEAHSQLAELVCDLGERSMRPKRARRAPAYQPVMLPPLAWLGTYYTRQAWAGLPGPWPVKVAALAGLGVVAVMCTAIPGPLDEAAVLAVPKVYRWARRLTRKAAVR